MKRPLTLTGFILGTTFQGLLAIESLIVFGAGMDAMTYAASASGMSIVIIVLGLTLALAVLGLIFNAISIPAWNKSPEDYRRKRGVIITAIVFNFIVVLLSIIGFAGSEVGPNFFAILEILGIIAANVLGIIDISREKRKIGIYDEDDEDGVPVDEDDEEFVAVTPQYKKPQTSSASLEDKIIKLNQMKEAGLIDDDEYKELKKKYISELL